MEDRTFGALPEVLAEADRESLLDALRAELIPKVAELTTTRFRLWGEDADGAVTWGHRGMWGDFNTDVGSRRSESILQRSSRGKEGDVDPLKLSALVIVETCTAIGRGDEVVFPSRDGKGPFNTGDISALVGPQVWSDLKAQHPGEPNAMLAVRVILGAFGERDRQVLMLSQAIQEAGVSGEVVKDDAGRPTD